MDILMWYLSYVAENLTQEHLDPFFSSGLMQLALQNTLFHPKLKMQIHAINLLTNVTQTFTEEVSEMIKDFDLAQSDSEFRIVPKLFSIGQTALENLKDQRKVLLTIIRFFTNMLAGQDTTVEYLRNCNILGFL
mmetsp:Transcript_33655/g.24681  ORF Transcript_33655/g.24681 Transcript_33655/m.24681 type:complete len:134 (+) Transcript_33655:945-1346(+)|eukprot:CAMPEP_0202971950 /NCGR_PEP_ID=MMETSP1396-20130829/32075_1 /ASSEMBLY_ACC=CAM_ASM_000872 /TAXON_ID= /ORGANISM="Pseudokeronopsis sp., Strain Brazil" /LENGTH=133 /DNA_ID=CAMNT_0049701863 /DNA_START=941 /DNA_END=1342 /DNA_ORIENTATION=-